MSAVDLNAIKTVFQSYKQQKSLFSSDLETASKKHTLKIERRIKQLHNTFKLKMRRRSKSSNFHILYISSIDMTILKNKEKSLLSFFFL